MGNIEAAADGTATLTLTDPLVQLIGEFSVIGSFALSAISQAVQYHFEYFCLPTFTICFSGRSFCVYKNKDDLGEGGHDDSLSSGHSGKGLACGIIGIA